VLAVHIHLNLKNMSEKSKRLAGILLLVLPTVIYGGVSILTFLINDPSYMQNPLRQDLFRAGHAHAGVLLLLSLVSLLYVDNTKLNDVLKGVIRFCIPFSAILLPAAFFFSVLKPVLLNQMHLFICLYRSHRFSNRFDYTRHWTDKKK
jgi:hypothetical protein